MRGARRTRAALVGGALFGTAAFGEGQRCSVCGAGECALAGVQANRLGLGGRKGASAWMATAPGTHPTAARPRAACAARRGAAWSNAV